MLPDCWSPVDLNVMLKGATKMTKIWQEARYCKNAQSKVEIDHCCLSFQYHFNPLLLVDFKNLESKKNAKAQYGQLGVASQTCERLFEAESHLDKSSRNPPVILNIKNPPLVDYSMFLNFLNPWISISMSMQIQLIWNSPEAAANGHPSNVLPGGHRVGWFRARQRQPRRFRFWLSINILSGVMQQKSHTESELKSKKT